MKAFLISPFKVAREVNLRRVEHASASLSKGLEKINQQAQPISVLANPICRICATT